MILGRRAEHFKSVQNRPSNINSEAIDCLSQVHVNEGTDEIPTLNEIERAIRLLSTRKARGSDSFPVEIYKEGGMHLTEKLLHLFNLIWEEEATPRDFKDASIIIFISAKETARPVTTIEEYPCCPMRERW